MLCVSRTPGRAGCGAERGFGPGRSPRLGINSASPAEAACLHRSCRPQGGGLCTAFRSATQGGPSPPRVLLCVAGALGFPAKRRRGQVSLLSGKVTIRGRELRGLCRPKPEDRARSGGRNPPGQAWCTPRPVAAGAAWASNLLPLASCGLPLKRLVLTARKWPCLWTITENQSLSLWQIQVYGRSRCPERGGKRLT